MKLFFEIVLAIPALIRAALAEEHDIRIHAADAGMTPDEWLRSNIQEGL